MTRPRLILADDHPLILNALGHLLSAEFEIVRTVADGAALIAAARETEADLLITDLEMPELNGVRAIARLREQLPGVRIIALSMHGEASYAREALAAGAMGYVVKTEASEELISAIHSVLRGEIYISSSLRAQLGRTLHAAASSGEGGEAQLSHRQRRIMGLLAQGRTAKQIAAELNISAKTVEYHRARLLEILQLETTAELIRYGTRLGLV